MGNFTPRLVAEMRQPREVELALDTVIIDDSGDPDVNTGTYLGNTVTGLGMTGSASFESADTVEVRLGAQDDTFYVPSIALGQNLLLNAGGGQDRVYVGTGDSDVKGTLSGVQGTLVLEGDSPEDADELYFDDRAETAAQTFIVTNALGPVTTLLDGRTWRFDTTTIARSGMSDVIYRGFETVVLGAGDGNDTVNVEATHRAQDPLGGKSASIDDFEKLATRIAGQPMRYFFARWVEGTGVPEFNADYQIIRTRGGKFITRGTVSQNYDNLRLPLELQLRSEGDAQPQTITVNVEDSSADFNIESTGKPLAVIIDPNFKLLRISSDLRTSSIARRGIEQFKEGNYVEAQAQFEAALKLDRSNAWIYYHLGLLYLEQRNYDLAIDNFKAARDLGNQGSARPAWLHVWSEIKMGNAYDAKGDRTRAVGAYKRAETIGDNYDNAQDAVKRYMGTPFDPKDKQTNAIK